MKQSCSTSEEFVSYFEVFRALETLKSASAGPDNIPVWLLRLGSPFLAEPLAFLYNTSVNEGYVPVQWKMANITPIPKVPSPTVPSDYRPICITPIVSKILERFIVTKSLYPAISSSGMTCLLGNQFAFRPTGSTTAAMVMFLSKVTNMLQTEPYVHVVALDFSKAFDTVRHSELCRKLASVPVKDSIYNWITSYLGERCHRTKVSGELSKFLTINSSVVQGSAIGPVAYIINAADLSPCTKGNDMLKYADDSYLLVPASNSNSIETELQHLSTWAKANNLKLNSAKTQELIVYPQGRKNIVIPPENPSIRRVDELLMLGITIQRDLKMKSHIDNLVSGASSDLFALKLLRSHGLSDTRVGQVCRSTLVSKLLYASPAWRGFCNEEDLSRLSAVVRKAVRWGVYSSACLSLNDEFDRADEKLFSSLLNNPCHVLHQLLPPTKNTGYNLRARSHGRVLPTKTSLTAKNFIIRLLYSDI